MNGHEPSTVGEPAFVNGARRLAAVAEEAARLRALAAHPEVVALRVERVRRQVDVLLWTGVILGLLFTMVNVQRFAAGGAEEFTATWWTAWLLDPMVSLVLLATLRAEQITTRYSVPPAAWARVTKWSACASTYAMNTWEAWGLGAAPLSPPGIVVHSIPPLVVFLAAETGPELRHRLTEAARRAANDRDAPSDAAERDGRVETPLDEVDERGVVNRHEPLRAPAASRDPDRSRRRTDGAPARRRMLADYLAEAEDALARAVRAGTRPDVTPSWCRQVTGCSAGTSVKLAAVLRARAVEPTPSASAVSGCGSPVNAASAAATSAMSART